MNNKTHDPYDPYDHTTHSRAHLAQGGRIVVAELRWKIERISRDWTPRGEKPGRANLDGILGAGPLGDIAPFNRVQLAEAIRVCCGCRSLSEADRQ